MFDYVPCRGIGDGKWSQISRSMEVGQAHAHWQCAVQWQVLAGQLLMTVRGSVVFALLLVSIGTKIRSLNGESLRSRGSV